MQSLYWVVGQRGSGKTQVLEIIAKRCMENYRNWQTLPIVISILGLKEKDDFALSLQKKAKKLMEKFKIKQM